jgi:SRSO17 transposase
MEEQGSIVAWIVDDTGFVKKGTYSVGVARQYCGQVGKQENCRVAVSLSISTMKASLPIAWRLYLPEVWTQDKDRRKATGMAQLGAGTYQILALHLTGGDQAWRLGAPGQAPLDYRARLRRTQAGTRARSL